MDVKILGTGRGTKSGFLFFLSRRGLAFTQSTCSNVGIFYPYLLGIKKKTIVSNVNVKVRQR